MPTHRTAHHLSGCVHIKCACYYSKIAIRLRFYSLLLKSNLSSAIKVADVH